MSTLIRGDQLPAALRREVLGGFPYRWTVGNRQRVYAWTGAYGPCPGCDIREPVVASSAHGHNHPTVRMTTDAKWLAIHAFWVTKAGRLDARRRQAEPASMVDA